MPVSRQETRLFGIGEIRQQYSRAYFLAKSGVLQAENHFDAFVEVAGHPIGAAQINFGVASIPEDKHAAVLEKTPYDAADPDSAADAANAGPQGAGPANDQFHVNAGL